MTIEAWQVAFDRAREAVGEADERFQLADQEFAKLRAANSSDAILEVDHQKWMVAKEALDKASAAWTVIARIAPTTAAPK